MIQAAGGVVWRTTSRGRVKVLLVHRPGDRDWSLPKGKLRSGENALHAAIREVREETGMHCRLGPELRSAAYVDRKRRRKRVRYWAMEARNGRFRANDEVDRVVWLPIKEAIHRLTYRHDVPVLVSFRKEHA